MFSSRLQSEGPVVPEEVQRFVSPLSSFCSLQREILTYLNFTFSFREVAERETSTRGADGAVQRERVQRNIRLPELQLFSVLRRRDVFHTVPEQHPPEPVRAYVGQVKICVKVQTSAQTFNGKNNRAFLGINIRSRIKAWCISTLERTWR